MQHEPMAGAVRVDLAALSAAALRGGPQWAHESEDVDLTLLHWTAGEGVASHVNGEVDVVVVVVAGTGEASVDGAVYVLGPGQALLIPKGAERSLRCPATHWSYLSLHRRRRGLWPAFPA